MSQSEKTKSNAIEPWLLVALGFIALGLTYSARALLGLIMPLWEGELGWSRSFVSSVAAIALIVMAALAPIGGRLVDVQGPRNTLVLGLVALSVGCFVIAVTSDPIVFAIAFGGISAVGFGLVATHVVSTAVEQRFERNRGLASGVATSGSTAGQFVIVPLIAILLATTDWRWSFAVLGLSCVLMIVGILFVLPSSRKELGSKTRKSEGASSILRDIVYIFKKPTFHLLFWSYLICGYTTTGVIETHFLPYASLCGFGPVPSATAYGLLSAVNLGGMILVGWLTDRMNRPLLLGGIYIIRGLSFLILVSVGSDINILLVFAILFGLVDYSTVPVTASIISSHIGVRVMGLAFGLITAGHQVGAAIGAYLGGYLFDIYEKYDVVWWSSLWLAVLAGLLVLPIKGRATSPEAAVAA